MVVARLLARRLVTLVHTLLAYFDTEEEREQVCEHQVNPFLGEHEFGDYLRCNWCNQTPFSAS